MCVGIDVDPVAHATAAAALAPLLARPGAPTLHQLSGNYRYGNWGGEAGREEGVCRLGCSTVQYRVLLPCS